MPGASAVGALTIQSLIEAGVDASAVIAGARSPERAAHLPVPVRRADYNDAASMTEAFAGVDTLALIPSKTPPAERCVEYANAIGAAHAAGVRRVVFLSIVTAAPDSVSAIAPFILFAENLTRNSAMDWAIVRMGLYLEPVAAWAPELIKMGRLPYPVQGGNAAYVSREDVARTLAAVCKDPARRGEIYYASADPVSMPELAEALSLATGKPIPFNPRSDEEFIEICNMSDEPPFITKVLLSLYKAIQRDEMVSVRSDVAMLTGQPAETPAQFFARVL